MPRASNSNSEPQPRPDIRIVPAQPTECDPLRGASFAAPTRAVSATETPSAGSAERDEVSSPVIAYGPLLDLVSLLPSLLRGLFWRFTAIPEDERFRAALETAGVQPPGRVCRAFHLRDKCFVRELLTHRRTLDVYPVAALEACVQYGIRDSNVLMRCAQAALEKAGEVSHQRAHEAVRLLPLSEAQRTELALLAARKQPFVLAKLLGHYNLKSPENSKEVIKAILYHDTDGRPEKSCLAALQPALDLDYGSRVELGFTLACRNPYVLARDFKLLRIEDEGNRERAASDRRRLAIAAAGTSGPVYLDDCRRTIAANVQNFGIEAREDLARLAVLCAGVSGGDTARFFACFGAMHESERFAVALEAAASRDGAGVFLQCVRNFRIEDSAMLRAVGARHAQAHGWPLADFLETFSFRTRAERREVALAITDTLGLPGQDSPSQLGIMLDGQDSGASYRRYLAKFGFESVSEVVEVLLPRAASVRPVTAVRALCELGVEPHDLMKELRTVLRASPDGLREIHQEFQDLFAAPAASELNASPKAGSLSRARRAGFEEMLRCLVIPTLDDILEEWRQQQHPKLLKDVQNVFEALIVAREIFPVNVPDSALQNGRLEAMLHILKQLEENPRLKFSRPVTDWDLFGVAIPIAAQPVAFAAYFLTAPAFARGQSFSVVREGVRIAFGMPKLPVHALSSDQLSRLYETFSSAESAQGFRLEYELLMSEAVWSDSFQAACDLITTASVVAKLRGSSVPKAALVVEPDSVEVIAARLSEELNQEFQKQFALECAGDVMQLQREWGDLSPLTVLLARFKGSRSRELPLLRELVRHVLAGTFHEWKYSPEHGQLPGMNPAQVSAWRANRQRCALVSSLDASRMTDASLLADARSIFERNLLHHIPDSHTARRLVFQPTIEEALRRSGLSEKEFSREVESLLSVTRDVEALIEFGERDALQRYLKRFNSSKKGIASELPESVSAQVRKDLASILSAVRERGVDKVRRYLVFTCITDHPKILISVGDLVKTASCQSYKTGSMVETLPGYVVDANIKVQASFVVAEGKVASALGIGRGDVLDVDSLEVTLLPNRMALKICAPDGAVAEIDLGKAVCRRILRAGIRVNSNEPVIMPEPRYQQQHAVTSLIHAEQDAQLAEFESACGTEARDGVFEFAATRNPCGVYSDMGSGPQVGPYRIFYKQPARRMSREDARGAAPDQV